MLLCLHTVLSQEYIYTQITMSWWDLLEYLAFLAIIIQVVRLAVADGDLTLMWKERFGRKAGLYQF